MNSYLLSSIIIFYLAALFLLAFWAQKKARSKWVNNPYVYALSLAVYCSAWTYYGSVGTAATKGIYFLPIYLGPVIAIPLWIVLLRKVLRISRQQKIASLADFISLRYGKNRFLGGLITIVVLIATVPYISLQLKAVSETFQIMSTSDSENSLILTDSTLYIAILLALFAAFFGTQNTDASEKNRGIITTVAVESILKLVFFMVIGVFITFYLFDGGSDIGQQFVSKGYSIPSKGLNSMEEGFDWMLMLSLSFFAIFLLPRQFHASIVENQREKHLKTAIWMFPLYLLLFNLFVFAIAQAGTVQFGDSVNADYFAILLPLQSGNTFMATLVFLGGLSAVISMVVISTLSLSNMVSNNLIIPYGFLGKLSTGESQKNSRYIKNIRRASIFLIIIFAYFFYVYFSFQLSLYSIGLIAFVIIGQLAPSFFLGLFWNRGASNAAIVGIIAGLLVTGYTLLAPIFYQGIMDTTSFPLEGFFNIPLLHPHALLGIDFLSPPTHAFFWSMLTNLFFYLTISVLQKGNYRERNYAELFIDPNKFNSLQDNALVWKGEAFVSDIKNILIKFLGEKKTQKALDNFFNKYNLPKDTQMADARLINFSERLLTGSIGSASAKILIANVVKEEEISLLEVLKILEESKNTLLKNKVLKEQSEDLSKLAKALEHANEALIEKDKQKDAFLDTVAHELKTPLTGIRAATELVLDDEEMPHEIRSQFLSNILTDSDRLGRLIHNILDFEKLETGRDQLQLEKHNLRLTIEKSLKSIGQIAIQKDIIIKADKIENIVCNYDEDRILQVLFNILGNAIKFCPENTGVISVSCTEEDKWAMVSITDNGPGISETDVPYIFDKFYQSHDQNIKKPKGSGLGLAICKQIIDKHKGEIIAQNNKNQGVTLAFKLPIY